MISNQIQLDQIQTFEWAKIKNQLFMITADQSGKVIYSSIKILLDFPCECQS